MITKYVGDIALEMGIHVPELAVVEGVTVGCYDVFLLQLDSGAHRVNALVYQAELDNLQNGISCDRLEVRIRIALLRLQLLLKSAERTETL